jgi:hypothetical protein
VCDGFYPRSIYDTNKRIGKLYESELGSLSCTSLNAKHATAYVQIRRFVSMFNNIRMYNGIEKKEVYERQVTSITLIG